MFISSIMKILALFILCAIVSVDSASCKNKTSNGRPNIVFIFVDDLGWNDVGFNNPSMKSPNIDGLANSGVILNQSYVQPACSPSRSALMTGVYPFRMGLSHWVMLSRQNVCVPLNRTFFPQLLQENGYATHIVGKWHLGMSKWECTPTYRGFDSFYGFYHGAQDFYTKMFEGGYDFRDGTAVDRSANGTHSTLLYRNRIKQIITNHDTSKPMFLYLAFQEVHTPLQPLKEYYDMYSNIRDEVRRNFSAMLTALDDTIGQTVQALKDKGMYDNTLIVFSADNGGQVNVGGNNYPLRGGKQSLFEGGTRAAAFVHGPMFKNVGVRYDGLIHITDWYPTLLDAAKIRNKVTDQDGVSQWEPLLELSSSNRREVVYNLDLTSNPQQGQSAIRVGDYKLVLGYPGVFQNWYRPGDYIVFNNELTDLVRATDGIQHQGGYNLTLLFNLRDDPTERRNLADQNPKIVQELKQKLDLHKARYVPPNFPVDDPTSEPSLWGGVWTPGWG